MSRSTYSALGWPNEIAITIFMLSLILTLVPYCAGIDMGIFKVPDLGKGLKRLCKYLGPCLLVFSLAGFFPIWPAQQTPSPSPSAVTADFIGTLEHRANNIISQLREFAAGTSNQQAKSFVEAKIREFTELHRKHLEALRQGHPSVVHEVHRDILTVLARTAGLLSQFGQTQGVYFDQDQKMSERTAGDGAQYALYYPSVAYLRDLQNIAGNFSPEEFVGKELVAVLEYRAQRIVEELETIPAKGGELKQKFLTLHHETLEWLRLYHSLESQSTIYQIQQLLNEVKALVKAPEKLRYDPGYYDIPETLETRREPNP